VDQLGNISYQIIVLYLGIYKAPLAVMIIHRCSQCEHSCITEAFFKQCSEVETRLPKSQPEFLWKINQGRRTTIAKACYCHDNRAANITEVRK